MRYPLKYPEEHDETIETFCKVYSCKDAILKFLPDKFVTHDDGKSFISVNDPTLVIRPLEDFNLAKIDGTTFPYNSFDIVRCYKFGDLDLSMKSNSVMKKMPSYKAMMKLCKNDKLIKLAYIKGNRYNFETKFENWEEALTLNDKNKIEKTGQNLKLILLNDILLSQVKYDRFTKKDVSLCPEFHNERDNKVDDESIGKIALYFENNYGLQLSQPRILEMLKTTAKERGFNPVHEFIQSQDWDGIERIETVVIRYLGTEDTPLTRIQTRKWMIGAVARAFSPGVKFDNVLTLTGPQGVGKSTFLSTIAGEWFSDSFSFAHEDKTKIEDITGAWIVEISELNGMKRAHDAEAAKAFLSRVSDDVRPAYARKSESIPRSNVFAATTNETEFLQSCNGNRRWWIIPIVGCGNVSDWIDDLKEETPQLWAEAYHYYKAGETLYLPQELETEANKRQSEYTTAAGDELLEDISSFLERKVPAQYNEWPKVIRLQWQKWSVNPSEFLDIKYQLPGTAFVNLVCPKLIKEELPNDLIRNSVRYSPNYINSLMEQMEGWERSEREKVPGLHPDYTGADGRVKKPWIRKNPISEISESKFPSSLDFEEREVDF